MSNESTLSQMLPIPSDNSKFEQHAPQGTSLGCAVYIKGEVSAKENMYVNGRIEGTITLKDNKLEVGEQGCINANAFADEIVIAGKFNGDVYAKKVVIKKTGHVTGDIYTSDFSIDDGIVNGNIDMKKQDIFTNHHHANDEHDENAKGSGFGFLFKKGRDVAATETETPNLHELNTTVNVTDEFSPLSHDHQPDADGCYTERSFIGKTVVIRGELISEEDVIVEAHHTGPIYFKNNSLGVGANAQIDGDIYVKSIIGHGRINGNIYASEKVVIKPPAQIHGKISAPRISTGGALIMGSIEMKPQDIEKLFAGMGGSAVLEKADGKNNSLKDSAKPIFYPRS